MQLKHYSFFSRNNYHFSGKCIVLHHSIIDSCCIWCYATTKILSKYVLESIVIFALARLLHQVLEREFALECQNTFMAHVLFGICLADLQTTVLP